MTLAVVGGVAFVAALVAYWIGLSGPLSQSSTDWGTFGDFVGGMAGTVIALSTLIALVVALQLQAKELDETKAALRDQANTARAQLENMRHYEERRVQPILKAEWHPDSKTGLTRWVIKNVGLGPCILDQINLYFDDELAGNHDFETPELAIPVWRTAIQKALKDRYPGNENVYFQSMHGLKRALDEGEPQEFVRVFLGRGDHLLLAGTEVLETHLRAVIRFRSLAGVELTTDHQYDAFVRESGVGDLL